MKYHPDVNKDASATSKMSEINEAYNTLSDPEKKKKYDQFGEAGLNADQFTGSYPGGYSQGAFQIFLLARKIIPSLKIYLVIFSVNKVFQETKKIINTNPEVMISFLKLRLLWKKQLQEKKFKSNWNVWKNAKHVMVQALKKVVVQKVVPNAKAQGKWLAFRIRFLVLFVQSVLVRNVRVADQS
jgi:hypothetical protein